MLVKRCNDRCLICELKQNEIAPISTPTTKTLVVANLMRWLCSAPKKWSSITIGSWLGMGVLIWAARMAWAMAVISKLEASSSSSAAEFPQCMRNRPDYAVRALPAVTKLARLLRSNSAVEWCHDQPIFRPMRWMQCRCEPRMTMLGRVGNRICRTACVKLRCWKLDLLHGVFRFDLW